MTEPSSLDKTSLIFEPRRVDDRPVVEVLKAVPAVFVVVGPPLVAGLAGRALLGAAWPLLFCAGALVSTASERENYDMQGLGVRVFGAAAVVSLFALLVGVGIRRLRT